MKIILYVTVIIGILTSCSEQKSDKNKSIESKKEEPISTDISKETVKQQNYRQIKLKENSIDSFALPFPEENMLLPLRNYYKPYWVEANIGQQDGPDFMYIDILKYDTPLVYFNFDSENELILNSIIVHESTVTDQYGLNVGSTIEKLKENRGDGEINFDPYHQHVYYYYENSNISYEINGDLEIPADIQNIEDLIITEKDVEGWTIEYIIWRKK
ncbi:hypothetical protein [uncultured Maribacter sp.]|uniref:hypothetical protein n=1 Tax=uncultured Maribacter sp. TaxID=431308 RepID=UPI002634E805|nr:hypothetical protein [uncultured Maribacter sp.]